MDKINSVINLFNKNEKKVLKKLSVLESLVLNCNDHFKALEFIYDFIEKHWNKYLVPFASCSFYATRDSLINLI